MVEKSEPAGERKLRADAVRNRQLLITAAKSIFAEKGSEASLDEIARAAAVGIGTLYRHFPTRDALVSAVYQNDTEQLSAAAPRLMADHAPVEALRAWLRLFVEHLATKQMMAEALNSIVGGTSDLYARSGVQVKEAIAMLVNRAVENGDIHLNVDPLDLLRALAGVAHVGAGPEWKEGALRLVDILIAGLRAPGGQAG
ncbi:MAG: TetR/AcrR family transcriptional regulator [Sphingobium phenoxybenzoativorans]